MSYSTDEDEFTLLMLAMAGFGGVVAAATAVVVTAWNRTLAWLLEHQVIVPASRNPLLEVPKSGGAGLDSSRCFIAGAMVLLLVALLVQLLRRRWAARQELA